MTLQSCFARLFEIMRDDHPGKYAEIAHLAARRRAVITNGRDWVVVSAAHGTVRVRSAAPQRAPVGRFEVNGLAGLIDGQVSIVESIERGAIDCAGSVEQVLSFWRMLTIIIFVSARSARTAQLWREYRTVRG